MSLRIPDDTCIVAVAKNNISGYAEIEISGKKPLTDFSIFMWVKTRLFNYVGNMSMFSYIVEDDVVLCLAHYGKQHRTRFDLFDTRM